MLHLKNNIKLIRELSNKTQGEFAALLDVKDKKGIPSKDKIYNYEAGKAPPSDDFIKKLSALSGVKIEYLKERALSFKDIKIDEDALLVEFGDKKSKEDYKEKYIKQLEKENDRLNNSLESVETNLILIRKYAEVLVAWVEAFASSAPSHLSKNSEEAASWLQDIHKRLVDNLPPHAKGDISVGSLSTDKKLS